MPVYSNTTMMVPPGLSVLPSNNIHNISVDLLATAASHTASTTTTEKAPATPSFDRSLRPPEASTISSTPTVDQSSVLAVRTVQLASPAPSTASTATCPPDVGGGGCFTTTAGHQWPPVPPVVEAEPVDRISPIDEYNTLSRHIQSVRASIKLKESRII